MAAGHRAAARSVLGSGEHDATIDLAGPGQAYLLASYPPKPRRDHSKRRGIVFLEPQPAWPRSLAVHFWDWSGSACCADSYGIEPLPVPQDRPDDPRQLVGQGDNRSVA